MLFAITESCNIEFKWRGCQKQHIRQVMVWQLQTQCMLGTLHFGEELLIVVCRAKHAHYLLGVEDKVKELSRQMHMVLTEIKKVANKKLELKISWTMSSICSWNATSSQSTSNCQCRAELIGRESHVWTTCHEFGTLDLAFIK